MKSFSDECEDLLAKRTDDNSSAQSGMINTFLRELNEKPPAVCVIAATNCPSQLDPAFLRRLKCMLLVELPDEQTRIEILKKKIASRTNIVLPHEIQLLGKSTENFSGSDIENLIRHVSEIALERTLNASHCMIKDIHYYPTTPEDKGSIEITDLVKKNYILVPSPLTYTDFKCALEKVHATAKLSDV